MRISPIIEVEDLREIHKNTEVMIFDVSNSKNAKNNYLTEHLDGAIFIDLNTQLADIKSDLSDGGRHPLPKIEDFAKTLTDLGISKEKHIIIYDDKYGSNAAARFWWMLKSVGHQKVQVLNGGLKHAMENHFPMSSKSEIITRAAEPYEVDNWLLPHIDINLVEKASKTTDYLIVDVRDKERYEGTIETLDLIAGHIPRALNIPFIDNLNESGLFMEPEKLRTKYKSICGEIKAEKIIVHCGSGVTACHTLLAMDYAEMELPSLYIGSWSEWSRNHKTIVKANSE
jgi:thiosulfate/3-mercaptopyruvate sulfurtransferase